MRKMRNKSHTSSSSDATEALWASITSPRSISIRWEKLRGWSFALPIQRWARTNRFSTSKRRRQSWTRHRSLTFQRPMFLIFSGHSEEMHLNQLQQHFRKLDLLHHCHTNVKFKKFLKPFSRTRAWFQQFSRSNPMKPINWYLLFVTSTIRLVQMKNLEIQILLFYFSQSQQYRQIFTALKKILYLKDKRRLELTTINQNTCIFLSE